MAETAGSCPRPVGSEGGAGRQTGFQEDPQTRVLMAQEMLKAVVGLQPSPVTVAKRCLEAESRALVFRGLWSLWDLKSPMHAGQESEK